MNTDPITDRDPGDETDAPRVPRAGSFALRGIHFEADPGMGAGAGGDVTGAADPGAVADPAAAVADPAAGGGDALEDGLDPAAGAADDGGVLTAEELRTMMGESAGEAIRTMLAEAERADLAAEAQRQAQAQAREANQLPAWDPFNPEVVRAHQQAAINEALAPLVERLNEVLAPVLETTQSARMDAGRGQAIEMLTGLQGEIGEFDHDQAILQAARHMQSGMEPEQALDQAAREQRAFEERIEQRAVTALRTNAQNLADQSAEPSGGAGAAAEVDQPLTGAGQRRDYRQVLTASLARQNGGAGVRQPTG